MRFLNKAKGMALLQHLLLVLLAVLTAFSYEIFVYPNSFAPMGINGLATMVQYLFHFNVGYMALLINLPMLIVAFFVLKRNYSLRTSTFIISFSIASVVLEWVDLSAIVYRAEDGGGAILAAIAGGFVYGLIYSLSIRLGGSTGGTDVIAAFINHQKPEYDTVWVIFALNAVIALISFFVYGMDYQAVILCIIYNFVCSRVSDSVIKGARTAAKFEVVTTHPEELSHELMGTLGHGCTVIPAKGMYSGTEKSMLVCVINRRQVVEFERIVRKYPDTFAYISSVSATIGKFNYSNKKAMNNKDKE